ncbi:MAG: glycosyltransferase [Paramuribaculum sp.]|nr:glycosyltransferase [Paramuribaculum sp.]
MKVALVCNSDLLGGAAMVTYRLMQALRHQGVDARMIVYTKLSEDKEVKLVGSRFMRGIFFMAERVKIMMNNRFNRKNLFKVSIANVGYPLHRHPWIKKADVVCLSWINQGLLSLKGIRTLAKMNKPIVWTMHDMWNCTGICHHAYECTRFKDECGFCPLLESDKPDDLSHKVWKEKKKLYDTVPINFVAVSNWLAKRCAESSRLGFYHLAGTKLIIVQGDAVNTGSAMTSSASDIYQLAQSTITRQQMCIDSLNTAIKDIEEARGVALKISPEIKVLFPQVEDIALASPVFSTVEDNRMDTVNVALVSFSSRMNAAQTDKFRNYLQARLGIPHISIVEVNPSVITKTKNRQI